MLSNTRTHLTLSQPVWLTSRHPTTDNYTHAYVYSTIQYIIVCRNYMQNNTAARSKTLILSVEELPPPSAHTFAPLLALSSTTDTKTAAQVFLMPPSDEYAPFWVISYWYFAMLAIVDAATRSIYSRHRVLRPRA